jgi:hypothetical protein
VVDRAKAMLQEVKEIEPQPEPPDLETQRAEIARAEDAMWGWYLEWSRIVRAAIKDRGLLPPFMGVRARAIRSIR